MDEKERKERIERYDAAFKEADAASAKGDAAGVTRTLLNSPIVDGLVYRLAQVWKKRKLYTIKQDDTEFLVADSLKEVYDKISSGRGPRQLGDYLYKMCCWKGNHIHKIRSGQTDLSAEAVKKLEEVIGESDGDLEWKVDGSLEKDIRNIRMIRKDLIPTLGGSNVQRVMDMIFEALEKGVPVSNAEMAGALGVTEAHIRTWRHRGFERLLKRLGEKGLLDGEGALDLSEWIKDEEPEEDPPDEGDEA